MTRDAEPACHHGDLLLRAVRGVDLRQEVLALGDTPSTATASDDREDDEAPLWEPATLDDSAPFYAWLAAETKVAMKLRRHLVNERGLPKQYVTSMGYWRLGKTNG